MHEKHNKGVLLLTDEQSFHFFKQLQQKTKKPALEVVPTTLVTF